MCQVLPMEQNYIRIVYENLMLQQQQLLELDNMNAIVKTVVCKWMHAGRPTLLLLALRSESSGISMHQQQT